MIPQTGISELLLPTLVKSSYYRPSKAPAFRPKTGVGALPGRGSRIKLHRLMLCPEGHNGFARGLFLQRKSQELALFGYGAMSALSP